MLIGVDHGNKQIKTVHCEPFVSGLKQSVTRPFGQNVLRYQNTFYTLSNERIPYRKDKTEDDRFFILTLLHWPEKSKLAAHIQQKCSASSWRSVCPRHTLAPRWSGSRNTLGNGE